MAKRTDIRKILMIGSGPVTIGRGSEYDLAGVEACRALREEGYTVVVANSNPVALLSDPEAAERTYLEPLNVAYLERIIRREKPEALLLGFGGPTALALGRDLAQSGLFDELKIEILGTTVAQINRLDHYLDFQEIMMEIGVKTPTGMLTGMMHEGIMMGLGMGFPMAIRSCNLLFGNGVMVAFNQEELAEYLETGLAGSPSRQVILQESLLGWKGFEFELLRDQAGSCVNVGSLEQVNPAGIHPGDSLMVTPAVSLSKTEYQEITGLCQKAIAALGLVGSINLRFALNPVSREIRLLKITPGLGRSAALVARATGLPLAAIAAKLQLGVELQELSLGGDLTAPDYITVRLPRFDQDKFPTADPVLNTKMKSVGEVMAVGRNFKEAFQKGLRGLATGRPGFGGAGVEGDEPQLTAPQVKEKLANPTPDFYSDLYTAFKMGIPLEEISFLTKIDSWFLKECADLKSYEKKLTTYALYNLTPEVIQTAKEWGFSNKQLAEVLRVTETQVRETLQKQEIKPVFQPLGVSLVPGTLASYFVTYDGARSAGIPGVSRYPGDAPLPGDSNREKILLIGSGPHRIGRGAEMDYWLDHAAQGLIECGYEAVIIHNNPVTPLRDRNGVRLYPEPVTGEAILDIIDREKPCGVILQGGGKAVSNLEPVFKQANLTILDPWVDEVSGVSIPSKQNDPVQKPPEDAVGAEVICIADGKSVIVCGVIEQIERAGIHSGDCAMALPPYTLEAGIVTALKEKSLQLVRESGVKGLITLRYAVEPRKYYLLRFHPRFTRNIPALSKVTGIDWVRVAVKTILGITLSEQGINAEPVLPYHLAKEAVFSFQRFRGVDTLLGPQMRATGMVAGIGRDFGSAFIKSQLAAGEKIPTDGRIFLSFRDEEKRDFTAIARQLTNFGFKILAAGETYNLFQRSQVPCERVANPGEGRPNILDKIKNGEIQWIISTPSASKTRPAESMIRGVAMNRGIPIITTLAGAQAIVLGLEQYLKKEFTVRAIQD
ncbi:MAG TPA: hypothetical protein VHY08_04135 [Bacillota bacterium]|nr:hypothetical protein [Bacillota bacterium]